MDRGITYAKKEDDDKHENDSTGDQENISDVTSIVGSEGEHTDPEVRAKELSDQLKATKTPKRLR